MTSIVERWWRRGGADITYVGIQTVEVLTIHVGILFLSRSAWIRKSIFLYVLLCSLHRTSLLDLAGCTHVRVTQMFQISMPLQASSNIQYYLVTNQCFQNSFRILGRSEISQRCNFKLAIHDLSKEDGFVNFFQYMFLLFSLSRALSEKFKSPYHTSLHWWRRFGSPRRAKYTSKYHQVSNFRLFEIFAKRPNWRLAVCAVLANHQKYLEDPLVSPTLIVKNLKFNWKRYSLFYYIGEVSRNKYYRWLDREMAHVGKYT